MGNQQPRILVVGLGNPILGDDGIGWRVAEAFEQALLNERPSNTEINVACYALGGLSLMEHLIGYDRAILIDVVQTSSGIPGTLYDLRLDDLPDLSSGHLTAVHDTSLQTALKLGQEMGASLPSEISIVGIEAAKVYDFSEALSPEVEASIPEAVALVFRQLDEFIRESIEPLAE
ncbi:MAG: hydrogenase maturation protease [Candidatus Promineifilaceae bacterium]|jgi:hydrogenase maturation protease